jgi:Protein of unknown function (DUF1566)
MKRHYFILIAMIASIGFATVALADPGTEWDKQINGPGRFKVLKEFGDAAVFDKETGRVWEQRPSTELFPWTVLSTPVPGATAPDALSHCYQLEAGGRKGWRVPSIEELASLVDTSQPSLTLPTGHPFNVNATPHWSSTTNANDATRAWAVGFSTGTVFNPVKTNTREVWCVRGGQGIDGAQ